MSTSDKTLKLSQKGLILIAVPLIFELVSFGFLFVTLEQTERELKKEAYARAVSQHINAVIMLMTEASYALYLYGLLGRSEQLQRYRSAADQVPEEFRTLHMLLDRDSLQAPALTLMEETTTRGLAYLDEARAAARQRDVSSTFKYLSEVKELGEKISASMKTMSAVFRAREHSSSLAAEQSRQVLKWALILATVTSVALAVCLYLYFNQDTLRRLAILVENTKRFAGGQPLVPQLRGDDEIAHLDSVFHDMTETITRAAREKQEFMAMITHDIRSPLTSVVGSLGLLEEPRMGFNLPEPVLAIVSRCQSNIDRLMRLINDLLDIEKFESGKMKMHFEITPIAYVFEQSVQTLKVLADRKNIKLNVPTTEVEVYADGDRLVQVLVNLLSNALKYSPDNSVIEVQIVEDESSLLVRVKDQGPGIPAEYLDKMFQRFQQVDLAGRRQFGGTGLGLAVCKEIVAAHSGSIGIDSTEGTGSTFWFTIPTTAQAMHSAQPESTL